MKKIFASALIITMCFSVSLLNAQTNIFTKGTSNLNVGIYIPTYINYNALPPISVSYDYGIADFGKNVGSIGIGAYAGLSVWRMPWAGDPAANTIYFNIGPRVSYHFNGVPNVPKLDLYGTLFLGLQLQRVFLPLRDENNQYIGLGPRVFPFFAADAKVGAKYWFTKSFCFYLEAGWGSISMLEGGVSFKF